MPRTKKQEIVPFSGEEELVGKYGESDGTADRFEVDNLNDPSEDRYGLEEDLEELAAVTREVMEQQPVIKSKFGEWSAKTAEQKDLKVLLYGPSGAGKTRFAATFPRPLFLDLENGLRSTLQVKSVLRYPANPKRQITNFTQVQKFIELVKADENPQYDTIVVDSLTELQLLIHKHVVSQYDANRQYEDQMTMADYGKANRDFIDTIRDFLRLPYNIVFTAIETPREYEEQQVYPKFIGKQTGPDLLRIMEMIGYCHVVKKGESFKHYCSFQMSPTYVAKDRMGVTDRDIPNDYESLISAAKRTITIDEEPIETQSRRRVK